MRCLVTALVLLVGLLAGACGASEPSARVVEIATQPAPPPGEVACMAALLEGTLALDPRTGLGVASQDLVVQPVLWPNGWHAIDATPVVVVDADGKAIARVGDHVAIGGGFGVDDRFVACPVDIQVGSSTSP